MNSDGWEDSELSIDKNKYPTRVGFGFSIRIKTERGIIPVWASMQLKDLTKQVFSPMGLQNDHNLKALKQKGKLKQFIIPSPNIMVSQSPGIPWTDRETALEVRHTDVKTIPPLQ